MPYDHEEETGYVERIVEGSRITTEDGREGIFSRAEVLDVTKERVDERLEKYDELYSTFASQMGLQEYEKGSVYYHHNVEGKPAFVDMAVASLSESPVSNDLYFVVEYSRALQYDIPILMVRLNDRLGVRGESDRLTVWAYDSSKKEFGNSREVRSVEDNGRIYKQLGSYLRNEPGSEDPFLKVASSVHSL